MSVPYQRISNATVRDIQFYDPAAERRASALNVDWEPYFKVGSQEWLYKLEFGWWQKYCDTVLGAYYYANLPNGQLISSFNPSLLIKNDQTLKITATNSFYLEPVYNELCKIKSIKCIHEYEDEDRQILLINGDISSLEIDFCMRNLYLYKELTDLEIENYF